MTVSSLHQLSFLCMSIAAGALTGVLYNLLAAVRERGGGWAGAFITDMLFWVAAGTALVYMSLRFNDGGIRGYQIFGAFCGFLIHGLCFGRLTMRLCRLIVKVLAAVLYPLFFLVRGVGLYLRHINEKWHIVILKGRQAVRRAMAPGKTRKKIRKKYKKLL